MKAVRAQLLCVYAATCLLILGGIPRPSYGQESDQSRIIRLAANPTISPDGERIAFSWLAEIWVADVDGGNIQRLTSNSANDEQPIFSPDGNQNRVCQ